MSNYWFVYIARCADGSYYCGVTTDPHRRQSQHNGVVPGGAKYTRSRRPVQFVYTCRYASRGDALRHEARLKKLSHADKSKYDNANYTKKGSYRGPAPVLSPGRGGGAAG